MMNLFNSRDLLNFIHPLFPTINNLSKNRNGELQARFLLDEKENSKENTLQRLDSPAYVQEHYQVSCPIKYIISNTALQQLAYPVGNYTILSYNTIQGHISSALEDLLAYALQYVVFLLPRRTKVQELKSDLIVFTNLVAK